MRPAHALFALAPSLLVRAQRYSQSIESDIYYSSTASSTASQGTGSTNTGLAAATTSPSPNTLPSTASTLSDSNLPSTAVSSDPTPTSDQPAEYDQNNPPDQSQQFTYTDYDYSYISQWSPDTAADTITYPVKFFASDNCTDSDTNAPNVPGGSSATSYNPTASSSLQSALGLNTRQLKSNIMNSTALEVKPILNAQDGTAIPNQPWQIPGIPTSSEGDLMVWNSVMINAGYVCEFKNASERNAYVRFGRGWVDDGSKGLGSSRCVPRVQAVAGGAGNGTEKVPVYDFSSALGYYICHNGTGIRDGIPLPP